MSFDFFVRLFSKFFPFRQFSLPYDYRWRTKEGIAAMVLKNICSKTEYVVYQQFVDVKVCVIIQKSFRLSPWYWNRVDECCPWSVSRPLERVRNRPSKISAYPPWPGWIYRRWANSDTRRSRDLVASWSKTVSTFFF